MERQIKTRCEIPHLLNRLGLNGHGVEVGVQKGIFSSAIASVWKFRTLHLVDAWEHQTKYQDVANVSDAMHNLNFNIVRKAFADDLRVNIIKGYSVDASKTFLDESLDFVYLDARHDEAGILEDMKAWFPKLTKGGLFAGHDYVDGKLREGDFGVKRAVGKFTAEIKNPKVYVTNDKWPSWYFFKEDIC